LQYTPQHTSFFSQISSVMFWSVINSKRCRRRPLPVVIY